MAEPALVLVVDDNEDVREVAKAVLNVSGFDVATAEDGESAMEQAALQSPAIILLDMSMPGLDGLEVARRLQGDQRTREIPIIAVTGHSTVEWKAEALEAGCVGVLTKPVHPRDMVVEIRRVIEAA